MWDIKYRPAKFSDVLGQDGPVEVLKARLKKGTALDTSYIFSGGAGRGKTTLARILSRALLCQSLTPDCEPCNACDNCKSALDEESAAVTEMDAASRGTVEHVKAIVDSLPFVVQGAPKKVYIFDECHRMSKDAQDVLLKPIEDKQLVAILCTTEAAKIRGPIRTRCEDHAIRTITRDHILARMKYILEQEKVEYEEDAVLMVIDQSGGHVRDAINKLEMLGQLGPVTIDSVRDYLNLNVVSKYYEILLTLGAPAQAIAMAEQVMDSVSAEDLSEGLAEAAMNSFRLANNMFVNFSYVDRELATKVHAMYGDKVTHLAEYFLRSYRVSRTSIISDLVACQAGVPDKAITVAAPVVVQATVVPATTTPVVTSAPAPIQAPQGRPVGPAPTPTAPIVEASEAPRVKLTDVERRAMPSSMPRDNTKGTTSTPLGPVTHSADPYLPTPEFRSKLRRLMQFGRGGPA